ncbi:unnamed protein product [Paramecium sonneborni]|uniref:Uncharacterized protein n=1 Tax=Paramecium sonneborni TaxID=65129 RepID=A0A8S1RK46_9CILI|nr:unnamed protein product [Paramecium sonneborni]
MFSKTDISQHLNDLDQTINSTNQICHPLKQQLRVKQGEINMGYIYKICSLQCLIRAKFRYEYLKILQPNFGQINKIKELNESKRD